MIDAKNTAEALNRLDLLNRRMSAVEKRQGLHYWLGYEYALAVQLLNLPKGCRILDIGSGVWSIWPYVLAHFFDAEVTALDFDPCFSHQVHRRERAVAAGLCRPNQVRLIRADARKLPFSGESFDVATSISSLEHVDGCIGDRIALTEACRVVRPGGRMVLSMPFRAEGSMTELDARMALYQRHYSEKTLTSSMIDPSGFVESSRLYYHERWPMYRTLWRVPGAVRQAVSPWNAKLSRHFMRLCPDAACAHAVMLDLKRPEAGRS